MPSIAFAKGHGLGNDYIVLSRGDLPFDLSEASIVRICDRNWGIGSDGILMLVPSTRADFGLRIFNPDGSEAEKSGNGLRIFSKWLRDHGLAKRDNFTIETPGGVVECVCHVRDGRVRFVTVEMGRATFRAPDIPMNGPDRDVVAVPLQLSDGTALSVTAVSVGNPHCITFVDRLDTEACKRLGPLIERHRAFPQRTNVQFARVADRHTLDILIWERGAGYTLASGSSSCGGRLGRGAQRPLRSRQGHGPHAGRRPGDRRARRLVAEARGPGRRGVHGRAQRRVRGGLAHARHAVKRVCVFCGSASGVRPEYAEAARELAAELARRGIGLVTGGGSVGLMGVVADAALALGVEVIGVIPRPLASRELAHAGLTELKLVDSMHERKALMAALVEGFVALPGGVGTLEETFEVLSWAQLGIHAKPIGALNVAGYWDDLIRFLAHTVREGFVRPEYLGLIQFASTPAALLDGLATWQPPSFQRAWLRPSQT